MAGRLRACRRQHGDGISFASIVPVFWIMMSARFLADSIVPSCFAGGRSVPRSIAAHGLTASPRGWPSMRARDLATDDSVPEEHRGLHSALYGEGAGDAEAAHSSGGDVAAAGASWPGRLDGSELLDVRQWLDAVRKAAKPGMAPQPAVGLYALYDQDADERVAPWHIGYSRRVPDDLARWSESSASGGARFARVRLLGSEPRMWTRSRLEDARTEWWHELVPDGTLDLPDMSDRGSSRAAPIDVDALTSEERRALEERKWKLQMAMGQNLADTPADGAETEDAAQRRLRFLQAVEGDDWSSVIGQQNLEATGGDAANNVASSEKAAPMFSPFARKQATVAAAQVSRDLTAENVRAVLEALRPVLRADGGDIEVLGVNAERGTVMLGLMGACTSCPAAPSTMENGIEKALYDHFGRDVVREIVRVDSGAAAHSDEAVRRNVQAHLDTMKDALGKEGAFAQLAQATGDGSLQVDFSGPPLLLGLVKSSLSYRFPELVGRLRVRKFQSDAAEATASAGVPLAANLESS